MVAHYVSQCMQRLTDKLFDCNFQPLEVLSRWHDSQLRVAENYSENGGQRF